ncbi:MAG TPA: MFS transporter [Armatimonadota bacterium]|nr:MFS transporter [Armatimonadota bacterium]
MEQALDASRKSLFIRLGAIVFFSELAHGMLLYGIVPELVHNRFSKAINLFGVLPVRALEIAGICAAAYVLAELFFKLPAGHLVDQRGPDGPLRVGLILSLITVPIILLSKNAYAMLLGTFLHGLGAAPIWPAVISSWTRGRIAAERGQIMGQILTVWMAGLGLGLILGNLLVSLTGRQELAATYAPVLLWIITVAAALWGGQRLGVPARDGEDHDAGPQKLQLSPELKIMAVGLLIQNLAFGGLIFPFQAAVVEHFELNRAQFGLMVLLGAGPAVLLMGPMGKVSDRIGQRNAVIRSMLVVAPLILLAPLLKYLPGGAWARFVVMIPGLLVAGVAYALLLPAWHALALGRIPEQQRGRSLALLMSVEMVAMAGGHIAGPSLYEKVGFWAPFVFTGVTFLVLALIYMAGYILPPELPEESHTVDLSDPPSPGAGSVLSTEELKRLRPEPGASGPGFRSGE